MAEFLTLSQPEIALERLIENFPKRSHVEEISTFESLGRINGQPYYAPHALPSFRRSTVDGYALKAVDTFGANDSLPALFHVIEEVHMGESSKHRISTGNCALIHTGGMLPKGADSVVMLENTQITSIGELEVFRSIAVGENVIDVGEDIEKGDLVIRPGIKLRPAEIGGLLSLGIINVNVYTKPIIGIISNGDEIIPPNQPLKPGKVRDINAYTLSNLINQNGGEVNLYGIVPDDENELLHVAFDALIECDAVVITAGSSASTRDMTAKVIDQLGEPGVLVHGINIKPGKPTILGVCNLKPVIGLPGNPVSALVIAKLFVIPVINKLSGLTVEEIPTHVSAQLATNVASQAGRVDWIAVQLIETEKGFLAHPIFGKSNLIFTLVHANGLVKIPADATGIEAGNLVDVILF